MADWLVHRIGGLTNAASDPWNCRYTRHLLHFSARRQLLLLLSAVVP